MAPGLAADSRQPCEIPGGVEFFWPVSRIRPFKGQPREHFDGIGELADSINEVGQLEAIKVRPFDGDADYDFELVDGERRHKAIHRIEHGLARCVIRDVGDRDEQFVESVAINFNRQPHSDIEVARICDRLRLMGKTQAQMAALLGKKPAWVNQRIALLRLRVEFQERMEPDYEPEEERMNFSLGLLLSRFHPDEQIRMLGLFAQARNFEQMQRIAEREIRNPGARHPQGRTRTTRPAEAVSALRSFLDTTEARARMWCERNLEHLLSSSDLAGIDELLRELERGRQNLLTLGRSIREVKKTRRSD